MAKKNGILTPEEAVKALLGDRGIGVSTAAGRPAATPVSPQTAWKPQGARLGGVTAGKGGSGLVDPLEAAGILLRGGGTQQKPAVTLPTPTGRNEVETVRAESRQLRQLAAGVGPETLARQDQIRRDRALGAGAAAQSGRGGMDTDTARGAAPAAQTSYELDRQIAALRGERETILREAAPEGIMGNEIPAADAWDAEKVEAAKRVGEEIARLQEQRDRARQGEDSRTEAQKRERWMELSRLQRPLTEAEKAEAQEAIKELRGPASYRYTQPFKGGYSEEYIDRVGLASALEARVSKGGSLFAGMVGNVPFLGDWAEEGLDQQREAMKKAGMPGADYFPEGYNMMRYGPAENPGTYTVGAGAMELAQIMTLSDLYKAGLGSIKGFGKLPAAVQHLLPTGMTFGTKSALDTASGGGDAGDVARAGAVGFAQGAAGSLAGEAMGALGSAAAKAAGLQNSVPVAILRDGLSGAAFAAGSMGANMALDPEYRPTGEEAAKDLAVAFAFSTLSSALNTLNATRDAKVRMQQYTEDMKRDYATIVNSADGRVTLEALDDLAAKSAQVRADMANGTYLGQQKTVDGINTFLDQLDDAIAGARGQVYSGGMTAGASHATPAGPSMLPGGGSFPALGGGAGTTPAVPGGTMLPTAADLTPGMVGGMAAVAAQKAGAANSQAIENLRAGTGVEPEAAAGGVEAVKPSPVMEEQQEAADQGPAVVLDDGTALDLPAFTDYYRRAINPEEPEAVIRAAFDALAQDQASTRDEGQREMRAQAKKLADTLRSYGIKDVVVDEAARPGIDAYWDPQTATVHVSPNLDGPQAVNAKVAHELAHAAELGDEALVGDLLNTMQALGRDVSAQVREAREQYKGLHISQGMPLEAAERLVDEDYAAGEVAARFVEEVLGDEDLQATLGREQPGLLRRIWEAIQRLVARIRARFGGDSGEAAQYEELARALRERVQARTGMDLSAQAEYLPTAERVGTAAVPRYAYGGVKAQGADLAALERAKEMRAGGVPMERIRQAAGWFVGMDGKWRFEIDDSGMEFRRSGDLALDGDENYQTYKRLLGKWIDGSITPEENELLEFLDETYGGALQGRDKLTDYVKHDALLSAYPVLQAAGVRFETMEPGERGRYDRAGRSIVLNSNPEIAGADTAIHEIQHMIQDIEGFTRGASPEYWMGKTVKENDKRLAELETEIRSIMEGAPQDAQNQIRAYNRAKIEAKDTGRWDEVDRLEDQLMEGPYREIFERYSDASFERALLYENNPERSPVDLYLATAGEIEARDVTKRRGLTPQERRDTPPALGDEKTVFAEGESLGLAYSAEPPEEGRESVYLPTAADLEPGSGEKWRPHFDQEKGDIVLRDSAGRETTRGAVIEKAARDSVKDLGKLSPFSKGFEQRIRGDQSQVSAVLVQTPPELEGASYGALRSGIKAMGGGLTGEAMNVQTGIDVVIGMDGLTETATNAERQKNIASALALADIKALMQHGILIGTAATPIDPGRPMKRKNNPNRLFQYIFATPYQQGEENRVAVLRVDVMLGRGDTLNRFYNLKSVEIKRAVTAAASPGFKARAEADSAPFVLSIADLVKEVNADVVGNHVLMETAGEGRRYAAGKTFEDRVREKVDQVRPTAARKELVDTLLKDFSIPAGRRAEASKQIGALAEKMVAQKFISGEDLGRLFDTLYDAGQVLVEDSTYDDYRDIRQWIRGNKVYVPQAVKAEFGDDWNGFRAQALGSGLTLTNDANAQGIDSLYGELADTFGTGDFPGETDEAAMLRRMVETAEMGRPEFEGLTDAALRRGGVEEAKAQYDAMAAKLSDTVKRFSDMAGLEIKLKQKSITDVEGLREHYRDLAAKQAQRRHASEVRKSTLNTVKWLRKKARYNSAGLREALEKQPQEVQEQVRKVLDELDTVAASMSDAWAGKWEDLRALHERFMAENPNYIPNKRTLENVARLDQQHLADMDPQTVEAIREVVLKLRHEMETSGKELGEAEAREFSDLYRQAKAELEHTRGSGRDSGVRKLFTEESLAPTRVLRMYSGWRKDGVFSRMAAQLEQGEYKAMDYVNRADRRFQAFMEAHPDWLKKAAGKHADLIELEVSPVSEWGQGDQPMFGEPVKVYMTPMMRVQMWLDYQSYDNRRHVKHGGYTFPDMEEYRRGREVAAYDKGRTIKLAPESVKRILEDMTPEEREYAKLLADYYNKFSKGEINRVSVEADGYERAISTWYSPILTDKNYLHAEPGRYDATLQGMGPLQERVQSRNPVLLKDADSVYRWHRDQMSRFVGLYIPERNAQRLLEWTESGFKGSTKKLLADTWGSTARQYMENLLVDLQSPGRGTGKSLDRMFNSLISQYVKSVLYFNPSVAVKQTASYPAAAATLGWDALRAGLNPARKVDMDLIAKYSPLLEYRAKGYSTQELADYVRGKGGAQDSKVKKMLLGIGWIQGMDIATVKRLWAASEYRVTKDTDLRPGDQAGIDAGTDPFYQKVAEVFNVAVSQTQPMYSQMHRPDLLKNGSAAVKAFSLMKTVPLQYAGMLRESLGEYQRAQEDYRTRQTEDNKQRANEARRGFARTVSAFLASSIVYCAMGAAVAMLIGRDKRYRDEDGDLTAESLGAQIGKELGGVVMGSVPGGEELYNFLSSQIFGDRWYDLEVPGVQMLNDTIGKVGSWITGVVKTFGGIADVISNDGEVSFYLKSNGSQILGPTKDLAEAVAALFGVPAANAEKYILGMVSWAAPDLVAVIENAGDEYTKANLDGLYGHRLDAALGQVLDNRVAGLDGETKDELSRLYKLEGGDVLPTGIPASVSVDGELVELSPYQQMVYEQTFNTTAGEYMDGMVAAPWFRELEDQDRARAVKYLYNYAGAMAKEECAGVEVSGWVESARQAAAQGVDLADYLHYKLVTDEYTSDETGDGPGVKEQKVAWLDGSGLSPEDRAVIYLTSCAGEKELARASDLERRGVTGAEYFDYVAGTISLESDKEDGKAVSGSLARKKLAFIDGMELADEKKAALYLSEVAGDSQREAAALLAAGGVPNTAYYAFMAGTVGLEADAGPDGKAVSGSLGLKKFRFLDGMDLSDDQKVDLFLEAGATEGLAKDFKEKAVEAAELGIDRYDFLKYYTVVYGISGDKDESGKSVAGSKQKKVWAYIDSLPLTAEQKDYLHLCEYAEKTLGRAPWHTGENLSGYLAGLDLLEPRITTRYGGTTQPQGGGGQVQTRYGADAKDGQGSGSGIVTRYGAGGSGTAGIVTRYG